MIVFVGAGNMAEAIVSGLLKEKLYSPEEVFMTDISEERLTQLFSKYGVSTSSYNPIAVAQGDVVVLSVKPQVFPEVWDEIKDELKPNALVVSIMAGIPTAKIEGGESIRVVRVMPNTPALIGEGAAGIAAGKYATDEDLRLVEKIMASVGFARVVPEQDLDAVTALSGSGPAYLFYLLEGMLEAAEKMGLSSDIARELAIQTVTGAAELVKETGESPEALRQKVTSKGGTTAAAIETLDAHGVKEAIVEALLAAQARSQELSRA